MKAYVTYDKRGRIKSVAIPSPEFRDLWAVAMEEGESVVAVDISEPPGREEPLTFATDGADAKRPQEAVRVVGERHRIDPATHRLVAKKA